MRKATSDGRIELTSETDPVEDVSAGGFMSVDVRTESGFTFRFHKVNGGYSFDDGYLPGENPDEDYPDRAWVFGVDEVPEHVVDALRDAGYEYTGKSAGPRAMLVDLGDDSEDDTWHDRAERYARAPLPTPGTPEIGAVFTNTETGETVVVIEHMFADVSGSAMENSPFVVKRESDGEEIGFESPSEFYEQYEHQYSYGIERENRPIDDPSKAITVERLDSVEQYMFELVDGRLLYQGPMNADEDTWEEVPAGPRAVAEDHFGTELVGDTDDLQKRRDSVGV